MHALYVHVKQMSVYPHVLSAVCVHGKQMAGVQKADGINMDGVHIEKRWSAHRKCMVRSWKTHGLYIKSGCRIHEKIASAWKQVLYTWRQMVCIRGNNAVYMEANGVCMESDDMYMEIEIGGVLMETDGLVSQNQMVNV